MKLIALLSILASAPAFAAEVKSARIEGGEIVVDVVHGGGCGSHRYELKLDGGCRESNPVQCDADLKHFTNDACEAMLYREARFNIAKLGLNTSYYANGWLTIRGSNNSEVTVQLPGAKRNADKPRAGRTVECVTHTGSILTIDAANKEVTLETKGGEMASYRIVSVRSVSLESMPPIAQTTYKLDDGRSVVTSFRGSDLTGTGNFIRLNGEYSPEFKSCRK